MCVVEFELLVIYCNKHWRYTMNNVRSKCTNWIKKTNAKKMKRTHTHANKFPLFIFRCSRWSGNRSAASAKLRFRTTRVNGRFETVQRLMNGRWTTRQGVGRSLHRNRTEWKKLKKKLKLWTDEMPWRGMHNDRRRIVVRCQCIRIHLYIHIYCWFHI